MRATLGRKDENWVADIHSKEVPNTANEMDSAIIKVHQGWFLSMRLWFLAMRCLKMKMQNSYSGLEHQRERLNHHGHSVLRLERGR